MKKQLFILFISFLSINCYAQISFEKGYFIDNAGQKTDCLIKNIDWKNNPSEFYYKLSENTELIKATIKSVAEFGITNGAKYKRSTVKIDRSSESLDRMSRNRRAVFNEEQLFLKILVEGKATLYYYEDGNLKRYFYQIDTNNAVQLVFKSYLTSEGDKRQNERYKQQLWNDFKHSNILMKNIKRLEYKRKDLVNFFVKYNKHGNSEFTNFTEQQKRDLFNFTIRPGLNSSSLTIQNSVSNSRDTDFDSELGFRLGIETEFIMPFHKNKWAIFIEPTYQYYKSNKLLSTETATIDYKSIELPIGIRHYFFLNDNSKVFINGAYVLDFHKKSKINFEEAIDLDIKTKPNLAFGLGYNYNSKYSVELRYGLKREILNQYLFWSSNYSSFSIIFGYTIF